MTTSKPTKPFSIKLKLVLVYLYLGLASSLLSVIVFLFGADQIAKNGELADPANRIAIIITSTILVAFYIWVLSLLHKRKAQAALGFVILTIATYGLSIIPGTYSPALSIETVTVISFMLIDIIVAVFLLEGKEAKAQLQNK